MYKKILVPLDGSELAERALPHALEIGRCMDSDLYILRVSLAEVYTHSPAGDGPLYAPEVLEADRQAAVEYLTRIRSHLDPPRLRVTTEVLAGPVAETIVDYARDQGVDLIVMSTHGRSGLSRWVFGSVADRVLHGAHCPTMIVRGQTAG